MTDHYEPNGAAAFATHSAVLPSKPHLYNLERMPSATLLAQADIGNIHCSFFVHRTQHCIAEGNQAGKAEGALQ